jgi:hypothetical protein
MSCSVFTGGLFSRAQQWRKSLGSHSLGQTSYSYHPIQFCDLTSTARRTHLNKEIQIWRFLSNALKPCANTDVSANGGELGIQYIITFSKSGVPRTQKCVCWASYSNKIAYLETKCSGKYLILWKTKWLRNEKKYTSMNVIRYIVTSCDENKNS